jgi:hypothetical protein
MDVRGDRLEQSFGEYTLAEIIRGLSRLFRGWQQGVTLLRRGLRGCETASAREELDNAATVYHVYRSAWNTYRAYRLRRRWTEAKRDAFLRIARNELANLEQVLPILERDPRLGWHSECQAYMFDAESVRGKMASLRKQLGAKGRTKR